MPNAATTLAEAIVENRGIPLHLDHFAERVAYFPVQGAAREITAVVKRSRTTEQEGRFELAQDVVDLESPRDAAVGLTDPQLGDSIRLAEDPPKVRWDFVAVLAADSASFLVRFMKATPLQSGLRQTAHL